MKFNYEDSLSVQAEFVEVSGSFGNKISIDGKNKDQMQFNINIDSEKISFEVPHYEVKEQGCCGIKRMNFVEIPDKQYKCPIEGSG